MADTAAIPVIAIEGSNHTGDGQHVLLSLSVGADQPLVLAFEKITAIVLAQSIALEVSNCDLKLSPDGTQRTAMSATWFELGEVPGTPDAVLTLTTQAGAKMSFRLPDGMAKQMLEVLQVRVGGSIPQKPDTPLN